jgi:hypothetical protein
MDKDFEKNLRDLIRRSHELARQRVTNSQLDLSR